MSRVSRAGLALALLVLALMPVGAGATGHASLAMLAFAGLFLLGTAVLRPDAVRLDRGGDLAALAVTAAAFSALLVSLGQALRALAGITVVTDLLGWVIAGVWALLLARIVWTPSVESRAVDVAERALRRLDEAGRAQNRRPSTGSGALGHDPTRDGVRDGARRAEPRGPSRRSAPPARRAQSPARKPRPEADRSAAARPAPRPALSAPGPGEDAAGASGTAVAERPLTKASRPKEPATAMTDPMRPPKSDPTRTFPAPAADIAAALEALDRLPATAPDAEAVAAALGEIADNPVLRAAPTALLPALQHRAQVHDTERDRAALVMVATDPAFIADRLGERDPANAFETVVAAADPGGLARFSSRARTLIADLPEAAADLPTVPRLIEIADQIDEAHPAEADGLIDLANALEDLVLAAAEAAETTAPDAVDA